MKQNPAARLIFELGLPGCHQGSPMKLELERDQLWLLFQALGSQPPLVVVTHFPGSTLSENRSVKAEVT